MSRRTAEETRHLVLEAARRALEAEGAQDVGLEAVARLAGVSRQAVYLHFGSRANLLADLLTYVEEREELAGLLAPVRAATSGRAALERLVDAHAAFEPRIAAISAAFERASAVDATFAALYRQRLEWRYDGMRAIARQLDADGSLASGWTVDSAAAFIWLLTASSTFRQLTTDRGWSAARWRRETKRLLCAALTT